MNNEDNKLQATPMDELLKQMVVQTYEKAMQHTINSEFEQAFRAYMVLYYTIAPYDFESKKELARLTIKLNEYLNDLRGKALNKADLIRMGENSYNFREILNTYMSAIPKSYQELGLWFKVNQVTQDWQIKIAEENFNSEFSSVKDKVKELEKIDSKTLLSLMKPNNIHETHSRYLIENAIPP